MAPTSIDGNEITGATIDGQDVSEITVDGQTVFTAIPDSGVVKYTFDDSDTSGSEAIDVWNGYNATINGATTGATGPNKNYNNFDAYDFDGNDDYVVSPSLPISNTTEISMCLWTKIDDTSYTQYLLQFGNNNDDVVVDFKDNEGFIAFEKIDSKYNDTPASNIGGVDTWYHLVATFVSNGDIKLYVDGSLVESGTMGSALSDLPNTVLKVGSRDGSSRFYDGSISDVRVYDKEITETQVSNLYNTGSING